MLHRAGRRADGRSNVEIGPELPTVGGMSGGSPEAVTRQAPSVLGLGRRKLSRKRSWSGWASDGGVRVVQVEGPAQDAGIRRKAT